MREYYVRFTRFGEEASLVVLPSFWKLLLWFLRTARKCTHIVIFTEPEIRQVMYDDPCDSCLRWDECNGVDWDNCPRR